MLVFLAGAHDIGKATATFQHRRDVEDPQLAARLTAAGMGPVPHDHDHPHAAARAEGIGRSRVFGFGMLLLG